MIDLAKKDSYSVTCPVCGLKVVIAAGYKIYKCFKGQGHSFYNPKREDDLIKTQKEIKKLKGV